MKKIVALLLAVLMCFSLCGCGKSEAVKNVESMIDAIGEVMLDSEAVIVAAEESYNALSEEEQSKVENYAVLTSAREQLDIAKHEALEISFAGEWVSELKGEMALVLNADNTLTIDGVNGTWELNEEETALIIEAAGMKFEFSIIEEDSIQKLSGLAIGAECLVAQEDYQEAFDKKFVAVELNGENVRDYLGDPVHAGYLLDNWGEEDKSTPIYLLTSKVYENGLVYIGCTDDFAVEIIFDDNFQGDVAESISQNPFTAIQAISFSDQIPAWYKYPVSIGDRAAGTLYYVREEYVAKNYADENNWANVQLTSGSTYSTGWLDNTSFSYNDYMR